MSNYNYYISVKLSSGNKPYSFGTNESTIKIDDKVVVETTKGIELGLVTQGSTELAHFNSKFELKPVTRIANAKDINNHEKNLESANEALDICREEIENLKLDMVLVSAEYTLDKSKLSFVYVADDRVDFRELLKVLATTFKCRIDLRQIGVRDKAKLVGAIGICGRETCCSRFKTNFDVISINMAKNQMLALNMQKLSGQCGKLMCCLKYEDEAYTEAKKGMPKLNSTIEFDNNKYRISSINAVSRLCRLDNNSSSIYVSMDELKKKGKF